MVNAAMTSQYHSRTDTRRGAGRGTRRSIALIVALLALLGRGQFLDAQIATVAPVPVQQFFDNSGLECASCKLYWYACGGTVNLSVYTDSALSVAHSQPITLNSAGRPPSNVGIFLSPGVCHKAVLKTSADVELWSVDNLRPSGGLTTYITNSQTGAQNNWAPTGMVGHTIINWSGASAAAITGIEGGVAGQIVTIRNTGSLVITFAHASGSSDADNRFTNAVTSGVTPVSTGGYVTYQYTGSVWLLVAHEQGAWITPTYAAGDFTASSSTWGVDAGDITTSPGVMKYRLAGRTLQVVYYIATTDVGAGNASIRIGNGQWGGFTATNEVETLTRIVDNAGSATTGMAVLVPSGTYIANFRTLLGSDAWTNTTSDNTIVTGTLAFEVN